MGTVPVLRTWVAGELVTAAYMNANIRDAGNFHLARPTFQARQTVAQSIPHSSGTAVLYDTENVDSDNAHSTSTNTDRYVPKTAGYYMVGGGVGFTLNTTGVRLAWVSQNGSTVAGSAQKIPPNASQPATLNTRTKIMAFNGSTDYMQVTAWQNSGAPLNTTPALEDAADIFGYWVRT